jgi:hypothetical protein
MLPEPTDDWSDFLGALESGEERDAVAILSRMVTGALGGAAGPDIPPLLEVRTEFFPADEQNSAAAVWHISGPPAGDGMDLRLPLPDLRLMAEHGETVLRSLTYALTATCRRQTDRPWSPHVFGRAHPPEAAEIDRRLDQHQRLPEDDTIEQLLESAFDVLVYGKVGVGKTMTATWHAVRYLDRNDGLVWLDLTDPFDGDESVAYALLTMRRRPATLVVIDNVQANVSAARSVFDLVCQLRANLRLNLVVLATGSPDMARPERMLSSTHLVPVPIDDNSVVQALFNDADLPAADREQIKELSDGDSYLTTKALELWRRLERPPVVDEIVAHVAAQIGVDSVGSEARRTLYRLACLSLFEIEMPVRTGSPELDELQEAGLVRLNDESYSIGPRSLAKLLVRHIKGREQEPLPSPDRVVYQYLQRSGAAQIKATLDRLDILSFGPGGVADPKGLAGAWGALGFLGDSLARRVYQDPTWGDEVASAAFAGIALAYLGKFNAWRRCAEFVRGRWTYDDTGELPTWVEKPSADLDSFQRMQELMVQQRKAVIVGSPEGGVNGTPLDAEIACRGWMLGVLLSFEATALDRDQERVHRLRRIAQTTIEAGALTSPQVPWVTAQVVLGLCLAGYNHNHPAIRHACQWLCQDHNLGGAYQSGWHNGVAGEASDAMATALCLSALLHAGFPRPERVRPSYERLCLAQDSMVANKQETELALIVEARIRTGDNWEDLRPAILHLLGWASRVTQWNPELRATRPGQPLSASAKAPFIAVQLWIIIWTTVNRELRRMLKDLWGLEDLLSPKSPAAPSPPPETGRPTWSEPAEQAVDDDVRRAVERLRQKIQAHIDDRASRYPTLTESGKKTFRREIDMWNGRYEELRTIERGLSRDGITQTTIAELNGLGRKVFGVGWYEIRY